MGMRLVIIESPFQNKPENVEYAKRCLADSLKRGEAPMASHLLYPQCLNDASPEERRHGMEAGWAWMDVADRVVVYTDRGITPGMAAGVLQAQEKGKKLEYRTLEDPKPGDGPMPIRSN